ncbi:MAG: hypothetical protein GY869_20460, partial [Planctomycetes bacterium]|nr:hypothetical protein [Planctomycetota bacterium]
AFDGAEVRGCAQFQLFPPANHYVAMLTIYSDDGNGELISFKTYDAGTDQIYDITETIDFEINGVIGTAMYPFEMHTIIEECNPSANMQASDGAYDNYVRLDWNPPANGDNPDMYNIYRRPVNGGNEALLASIVTLYYQDYNAQPGVHYEYAARSICGSVESDFSNWDEGWTPYIGDSVSIDIPDNLTAHEEENAIIPINLPVGLPPGSPSILAYAFVIGVDPTVIDPSLTKLTTTGTNSQGWTVGWNQNNLPPDKILVWGAGSSLPSDPGTLIIVEMPVQ